MRESVKRYQIKFRDNSQAVLSTKKGNYDFPWIPPIPQIPWNQPDLKRKPTQPFLMKLKLIQMNS